MVTRRGPGHVSKRITLNISTPWSNANTTLCMHPLPQKSVWCGNRRHPLRNTFLPTSPRMCTLATFLHLLAVITPKECLNKAYLYDADSASTLWGRCRGEGHRAALSRLVFHKKNWAGLAASSEQANRGANWGPVFSISIPWWVCKTINWGSV